MYHSRTILLRYKRKFNIELSNNFIYTSNRYTNGHNSTFSPCVKEPFVNIHDYCFLFMDNLGSFFSILFQIHCLQMNIAFIIQLTLFFSRFGVLPSNHVCVWPKCFTEQPNEWRRAAPRKLAAIGRCGAINLRQPQFIERLSFSLAKPTDRCLNC